MRGPESVGRGSFLTNNNFFLINKKGNLASKHTFLALNLALYCAFLLSCSNFSCFYFLPTKLGRGTKHSFTCHITFVEQLDKLVILYGPFKNLLKISIFWN